MSPPLAGLLGLVLLLTGGELLVRGASRLATFLGLSPLVVGLTVVAFGTSSPELAVSLRSSLGGQAGIALGNVVGSNIFNVLVILGSSALVTPLTVHRDLIRRETPLMVAVSAMLYLGILDGTLARWEGGLLVVGLGVYLWWVLQAARSARALPVGADPRTGEQPGSPGGETGDASGDEEQAGPGTRLDESGGDGRGVLPSILAVAAGLALLVLGAQWLVEGAVWAARTAGLDEVVIGLTVVAAGTSLPEVATSLIAAARGERDIAVGNVVGSNLFNVLCILGITGLVTPGGLPVDPGIVALDAPVMVAAAVACLPVFFTGHRIARWEGGLLLGGYAAYVSYLVLVAKAHTAVDPLGPAVLAFVIPLAALGLGVAAWRSWGPGRARP